MNVDMATCKRCGSVDVVNIREEMTDRSPGPGEVVGMTRHCKACGRIEELSPRDVVTNAKRVLDEAIRQSEEPPNRGNLSTVAPPQAKKSGATTNKK